MNNCEKVIQAIRDGHKTRDAIMAATGLTFDQWRSARTFLKHQGRIRVYDTEPTGKRGQPRGLFMVVEQPTRLVRQDVHGSTSASDMVRRAVSKMRQCPGVFGALLA